MGGPMLENRGASGQEPNGLVRCGECKNFGYFVNEKGHNTPHALGMCRTQSWDGNQGQWAMFRHACKRFVPSAQPD
jgi:hypothetical protein